MIKKIMKLAYILIAEWKTRHMQRVRINMPYLDRAWYKVHNCINDGWIFSIQEEYKTKTGMQGYVLCGAAGKPIPWRNKILAKWTQPVSRFEYWKERYLS